MAETMNVVVKEIVIRNCVKQIYVANGMIYNIVGYGESAGAQITPIDEATEVELYNALGPDDIERWPLAASLGQMADFTLVGENEKYLLGYRKPEKDNTADEIAESEKVTDNTEEVQNNENIGFDPAAYKVDNSSFDKVVEYLTHLKGEDFLKFVYYAKTHDNNFPRYIDVFANIINADDAYCSAIIKLTRHLDEAVEKRAFELFDAAADGKIYEANDFFNFWKALQVINFC